MKVIENTKVMESFGMNDLTMDEMLNIDGGFKFGNICAGDGGCFIRIGSDSQGEGKKESK